MQKVTVAILILIPVFAYSQNVFIEGNYGIFYSNSDIYEQSNSDYFIDVGVTLAHSDFFIGFEGKGLHFNGLGIYPEDKLTYKNFHIGIRQRFDTFTDKIQTLFQFNYLLNSLNLPEQDIFGDGHGAKIGAGLLIMPFEHFFFTFDVMQEIGGISFDEKYGRIPSLAVNGVSFTYSLGATF